MQPRHDDRPLGELFADLGRDVGHLVRQEIELAKTELSQKATRVGRHVGFLVAGAAIAYAGFLALLVALALGLAFFMPLWISALLVGGIVIAVGGAMAYQGMSALRNEDLTPQRTVETLKEDKEWVKQQVR